MSAAKHTPGPWEFDGHSRIYAVEFREPGKVFTMEDGAEVPSTEGLIALPYSCGATTAEGVRSNHAANARLIAAAPEMLALLLQMQEEFDDHPTHGSAMWVEPIRAAIAKAIGSTT